MLAALPILAQQVSVDDAMASAKKFFNSAVLNGKRKVNADNRMALAYTAQADGKNHFYVFNENDADGGFIIVGADEAAQEILGYCDHGNFDYISAPDNFKWWLSQYSQQISAGMKQGVSARKVARKAAEKKDVPMLLQTTWAQIYPYNTQIPNISKEEVPLDSRKRPAVGCVAVAMAQIMNFHKLPTKGQGNATCTQQPNGLTISADFGSAEYDWGNMKNYYGSEEDANSKEVQAVATLLFHCGVAVDTGYKTIESGGSFTMDAYVPEAFSKYFGYDKAIQCAERYNYSDSDWEQLVYDELAASRPVLYSGLSEVAGHTFVCDGYDVAGNLFHFNWGWNGNGDGFYVMTGAGALKPTATGTGGSGPSASFVNGQTACIGVKADEGGEYTYSLAWMNASLSAESVTDGEPLYVKGYIMNTGVTTVDADFYAKFTDEYGKEYLVPVADRVVVRIRSLAMLDAYKVGTSSLPQGDYTVSLVFRQDGGSEWLSVSNASIAPKIKVTTTTGIDGITDGNGVEHESAYSVDGKITGSIRKGLNVVKNNNGTVSKILVR